MKNERKKLISWLIKKLLKQILINNKKNQKIEINEKLFNLIRM